MLNWLITLVFLKILMGTNQINLITICQYVYILIKLFIHIPVLIYAL